LKVQFIYLEKNKGAYKNASIQYLLFGYH